MAWSYLREPSPIRCADPLLSGVIRATGFQSSNWHSIHKNDLARAMVAQKEQASLAIAQGNASKEPTVKILEHKDMAPFFVKGESDEPYSSS